MRYFFSLLLIAGLAIFSGCELASRRKAEKPAGSSDSRTVTTVSTTSPLPANESARTTPAQKADVETAQSETEVSMKDRLDSAPKPNDAARPQTIPTEKVSLTNAQGAQAAQQAFDRKIIRNADLDIETKAPSEGQRRIAAIVESHGGFVVTSDASLREGTDPSRPDIIVKLVARVPAVQFGAVLESIHGVDGRIRQEKISGQDVTEEYIDLEARIKTKRALEAQFLEIMKQAHRIQDALDVQTQLSDVRTEIERLEGRRRFLENQSSLSTINITLQPASPIVNTNPTGFAHELKVALGEGFDAAAATVLFLLRAVLSLLPITVFVVLPLVVIVRFFVRRARRMRLAREIESLPE